jgi:hypothetical protein
MFISQVWTDVKKNFSLYQPLNESGLSSQAQKLRLLGSKSWQTKHILWVYAGFIVLVCLHQIDLSPEQITKISPMNKGCFNAS